MNTTQEKNWQQVVMRCWTDANFKRQLTDNPAGTLASAGITVPAGVNVVVVEDEPNRVHLVIPTKPGASADLNAAAAAAISHINPAA